MPVLNNPRNKTSASEREGRFRVIEEASDFRPAPQSDEYSLSIPPRLALEIDDEKRQRVVVVLANNVVADHARLAHKGQVNRTTLAS